MTKVLNYKFAGTVARIEAGGSWEAIARDLGVGPHAVYRFAKRWGIRKPPSPLDWTTFSAAGDPIGDDGELARHEREARADARFSRALARSRGCFADAPEAPAREPHLRGGPDPGEGLGISSLGGAFIALALGLGLGLAAPTPASAHSWYSTLQNNVGTNCCGGEDCAPIESPLLRKNPDQSLSIWHAGKWYAVTAQNLLTMASPDGRAHACFHKWIATSDSYSLLCVILPGGD